MACGEPRDVWRRSAPLSFINRLNDSAYMKKSVLLYSLVLLFTCGCSNKANKNEEQSGGLLEKVEAVFEKSPKDIQPEGTFVSEDNTFYKSLTFKGKKTVA